MALTDIVFPNDDQEPFIVEVGAYAQTTGELADITDSKASSVGLVEELLHKQGLLVIINE